MTFAETLEHMSNYESTAYRIIAIFKKEGALTPVSSEYYFDEFDINSKYPGTVDIHCSAIWVDDKTEECIRCPLSWMDAFDEDAARAAAKAQAVERAQAAKQAQEQAQQKERDRKIAELRKLQEQFPEIAAQAPSVI